MLEIQITWSCGGITYSLWDADLRITTALDCIHNCTLESVPVEIIILGYQPK